MYEALSLPFTCPSVSPFFVLAPRYRVTGRRGDEAGNLKNMRIDRKRQVSFFLSFFICFSFFSVFLYLFFF